jgi:hypothetical protein
MTDGKESKNSFAVVKSTNSTGLNMKETQFILHIIYPKRGGQIYLILEFQVS